MMLRRMPYVVLIVVCGVSATALVLMISAAAPANPRQAPRHVGLPTISGTPHIGHRLYIDPGRWLGARTLSYRWKECNAQATHCGLISKSALARRGRSARSYLLTKRDIGHTVRVTVLATNAWGTRSATSRPTVVITPQAQTRPPAPSRSSSFVSTAYYTGFEAQSFSTIPWRSLTQLDNFSETTQAAPPYLDSATHGISPSEERSFVSAVHQHAKLAILSIGGSDDTHWSTACASPLTDSAFAAAIVREVQSYAYDGVDIDDEQSVGSSYTQAQFDACIRSIYNALHAIKRASGGTLILSADDVPDWQPSMLAPVAQYLNQINMMGYDAVCAPAQLGGCAGSGPESWGAFIDNHTRRGVPASKLVMGMGIAGFGHQNYKYLGATRLPLSTGGGITAIPVRPLSEMIPAGNIVVGTRENPPAHSQVFVTSGAAQGATSIPVSAATPEYPYPGGAEIIDDYSGPPDCANEAHYATRAGLAGVAVWTLQEDAAGHRGLYPCTSAIGPYVAP